jgi:hypothetical protein
MVVPFSKVLLAFHRAAQVNSPAQCVKSFYNVLFTSINKCGLKSSPDLDKTTQPRLDGALKAKLVRGGGVALKQPREGHISCTKLAKRSWAQIY